MTQSFDLRKGISLRYRNYFSAPVKDLLDEFCKLEKDAERMLEGLAK